MSHLHIHAADPDTFLLDDAFDDPFIDGEFDDLLDRQLADIRESLADFRNA